MERCRKRRRRREKRKGKGKGKAKGKAKRKDEGKGKAKDGEKKNRESIKMGGAAEGRGGDSGPGFVRMRGPLRPQELHELHIVYGGPNFPAVWERRVRCCTKSEVASSKMMQNSRVRGPLRPQELHEQHVV